MVHEIAKLLLENAKTFPEREQAIRSAMRLGMPLNEIESYLDWLDGLHEGKPPPQSTEGEVHPESNHERDS